MTELEEKTGRLVSMLEANDLDAVILNSQHNFAWLTGGGSNGVDLSRENGIASLVVTRDRERYVIANVIEIARMQDEETDESDFEPLDFSWQGERTDPTSLLAKIRFVLPTNATIASDIGIAGTPSIESKIAACRYSLTSDERDRFRKLGRDASDAMMRCIRAISSGESEYDIAETLRHELGKDRMASVVTLVAADDRISSYRHPVPTANIWKKTLLLVTCAKRDGLIASLSRMVNVGPVDDDLKKRTDATAQVYAAITDATRVGATGAELYRTAADAYAPVGFPDEINRHHQGGATGYRTREWVAHPESRDVVELNQAFAWNPSITGTKIEETIIVTDNGVETLTGSADIEHILVQLNGHEYRAPGIIQL